VKVRVRYTKEGKVRFTSHRDGARIWERALRRALLPVAYTEGFSPRPKISFGLALPTGYESDAEFLDVDLTLAPDAVDLAELPPRLTAALPVGFSTVAVAPLEAGAASLQEAVTSCSWRIELRDVDGAEVEAAVSRVLAADTVPLVRTRKGHETMDDLRPSILALRVDGTPEDGGPVVLADLATQPRALRPSELLAACFPHVTDTLDLTHRVRRTHQWIERDGARREPLPVTATSEPRALGACA
jgi:radical SAM-linked protein